MPLAPRPHSIMAGAWTEALAQGWKEQPSVTCCLCPGHHDSINMLHVTQSLLSAPRISGQ